MFIVSDFIRNIKNYLVVDNNEKLRYNGVEKDKVILSYIKNDL